MEQGCQDGDLEQSAARRLGKGLVKRRSCRWPPGGRTGLDSEGALRARRGSAARTGLLAGRRGPRSRSGLGVLMVHGVQGTAQHLRIWGDGALAVSG